MSQNGITDDKFHEVESIPSERSENSVDSMDRWTS